MMRRRNSKTSHSLLDLAKVGGRKQLGTPKELSRNGKRRTINGLGDREASVILGNKQLKTEVDNVYKEWVKETEGEGQQSADSMLAMMNSSITEPLLTIGGNQKDLVSTHLAESKGEQKLFEKMAQKRVQLYKYEDLEQEHNLTMNHIQEVLENVKKLCFPSRDENLSQRMKKKFQAKINCSAALDQRLTKITVLPESISPSEDIDEDDAEDENVMNPMLQAQLMNLLPYSGS